MKLRVVAALAAAVLVGVGCTKVIAPKPVKGSSFSSTNGKASAAAPASPASTNKSIVSPSQPNPTLAPKPILAPAPIPTLTGPKTYSIAQVTVANSRAKCWTVINGKVYDLTVLIGQHPGGDQRILSLCGQDGIAAFGVKHGGQLRPEQILAGFQIGVLR